MTSTRPFVIVTIHRISHITSLPLPAPQGGPPRTRTSKERDDYLQKQAAAQFAVPEDQLVEKVREVLARHGVKWG
jgi:hypothetical protein